MPVKGLCSLMEAIAAPFNPLNAFKPNKIWLFSTSGLKSKSDLFISIKEIFIPFEIISPNAFATFA